MSLFALHGYILLFINLSLVFSVLFWDLYELIYLYIFILGNVSFSSYFSWQI